MVVKEETNILFVIINDILKLIFIIFLPMCVLIMFYQSYSSEDIATIKSHSTSDMSEPASFPKFPKTIEKEPSQIERSSMEDEDIIPKVQIPIDSSFFAKLFPFNIFNNRPIKSNPIDHNEIETVDSNEYEPKESYDIKSEQKPSKIRKRRSGTGLDSAEYYDLMRIDRGASDEYDIKYRVGAYKHDVSKNIEDTKIYHFYEAKLNPNGEVPDSHEGLK